MSDPVSTTEPEYLGPVEKRGRSGRRAAVVGVAAAAVVGAAGVGGWGVLQLMSSGAAAATAVPAGAITYVSVDLDPSAGQKIDALRTIKKFPGLAADLDLGSREDIRRWLFDEIQEDGECAGLDYERDVASWLGNRVAFAAVPGDGAAVVPLVVLQSTDEAAARAGLKKLAACDDSGDLDGFGKAFAGDYVIFAEHQAEADQAARDAEAASLSDDADFQRWTSAAGDAGIVTMYASADAPRTMLDLVLDDGVALPPKLRKQLREGYAGFQGLAGVVRFRNGGVELEMASGSENPDVSPVRGVDLPVEALPRSTAAFLSFGVPAGIADAWTTGTASLAGADTSAEDLWRELEGQTGLQLPEDLETLLGDSITLSVDSSIDPAGLEDGSVETAPVAVRVDGDGKEIRRVVDQLRDLLGPLRDRVSVTEGDGFVVVGLDRRYVASLTEAGGLGDSETFTRVLPEADRASLLGYLDFDAGNGWAERLADDVSSGDRDVVGNVAPLDAVGASVWYDDDDDTTSHLLLKLTTD